MAKNKTKFICSDCGNVQPKWIGRCPSCQSWNTFIEEKEEIEIKTRGVLREGGYEITTLNDISEDEGERIPTGYREFDRVLGGGIVLGSLILLAGDPGIGKSTLLLQIIGSIAKTNKVLYVSGEESAKRIKIRARRLGIVSDNIHLMSETRINLVLEAIEQVDPSLVIIDSIQTMYDTTLANPPASVSQIKQCNSLLGDLANTKHIPIIEVGHVTKEGEVAGPRTLEHMVDTVLYFQGDRQDQIRILKTKKNRFGPTDEVGVFKMENEGLVEVLNPSELFVSENMDTGEGAAIIATMEGTRPIIAEIQALVVPSYYTNPKRTVSGVDFNRMNVIAAVLEKKLDIPLSKYDIYVNVVGGLKISERSADLAMAFAIASSFRDVPLLEKTIVMGEIGLKGELRNISHLEQRLKEAERLGLNKVIIPEQIFHQSTELEIIQAKSIKEAFRKVWSI